MKTILTLATVVTTSLILGGCTLPSFLSRSNDSSATTAPTSETSTEAETAAAQIAQAMEKGSSLHCTAVNTDTNGSYDFYVKGKQFRMDGKMTTDSKVETYHAINDSEYLYSWNDSESKGVKMAIPSEEELKAQAEQYKEYLNTMPDLSNAQSVEEYENQGYSIDCQPAVIDDAQFVAPTTVEFQDMSSMMEQVKQAMPSLTPEQQRQMQDAMKQFGQ